jgi:phosphoribosyl-AMP cyclohydrolase
MKCKRILAAIMAMGLVATSLTTAVSAADLSSGNIDIVEPAYVIANNPVSRVTISGTTATCYSSTRGNATTISITQTLQVKKTTVWSNVKDATWTKTVNANSITMRNFKYDLDSGTYRLKSEYTLTAKDGTTETITVYSLETSLS